MKKFFCLVDGGCPSNGRWAETMFGSYAIYNTTEFDQDPTLSQLHYIEPILHESRFALPGKSGQRPTNNVAEVCCIVILISTLIKTKKLIPENKVTICSDSQLVVNQITGKYQIRKPHLRKLYAPVFELFDKFEKEYKVKIGNALQIKWISGEDMKKSIIGH